MPSIRLENARGPVVTNVREVIAFDARLIEVGNRADGSPADGCLGFMFTDAEGRSVFAGPRKTISRNDNENGTLSLS